MPRFTECWRCGNSSATVACPSCNVAKYCCKKCKENDIARHKDAECRPISIIKTCSSCRKTGSSLQTCSACYRAFYCNANCQKNHRHGHKVECKRILDKIKSLARSLQGQFPSTGESRPFLAHYYWGNVPAYDYLNLLENEGVEYDSNMNVLVLGVGDLRNIVLTCASLPKSFTNKVKFVLNDSDSCVLSRLVLLMYMIIKCDLSVCKVVTEIWYSLSLSEKTYDYLFSSLQGLLRLKSAGDLKAATGELIEVHESHFKEFQEIWRHWLELRVEGTSDIQKQRQEAFSKDPSSFRGKRCYYNCIPKEHLPSAKKFMEDGIFKRTKRCSFAENPTLTGASFSSKDEPFKYCCLTSVLPFTGWDYVDVAKMMYESSVVIMYGNYIEFMLCSFMEILKSKQVTFEIILGNCMDIDAFLNKEEKYDRISTSNLMDYILLPNLMSVYSCMLNRENPFATLIADSVNWHIFCPKANVSKSPDVTLEQVAYLSRIVLQDTKDPTLANDGGTSFSEYLDNSHELRDYLRAIFYIYRQRQEACTSTQSKVPNFKELGNEFHLRLRDGFRNENRIVFFKKAVNRRRVTMITGLERYMEWVPI